MKKKLLSIVLTICMVASTLTVTSVTASAGTFDGWTKITDSVTISSNGNYYLDDDVEANITVNNGVTVTIDLNGHVLTPSDSSKPIIKSLGGNVTLQDSNPTATHTDNTLPKGGVITGSAYNAVQNYNNTPTFTMKGGTITGNNNAKTGVMGNGGAVNIVKGSFYMYGGAITGNSSKVAGGGVYVAKGANITVGGTAVIKNNTVNYWANDIQFDSQHSTKLIGVGTDANKPATGMDIWVYTGNSEKEYAVTGANPANYSSYFHNDDPDYSTIDGENHAVTFAKLPVASIGTTEYYTVQKAIDDSSTGDTVKILRDYTQNLSVGNGKMITLDLNGKTLSASSGNLISIYDGSELTLVDSSAVSPSTVGSGKLTKTSDGADVRGVYINNGCLILESGSIEGFECNGHGAGVSTDYFDDGVGIIMNGGRIKDCKALRSAPDADEGAGGGIYSHAKVIMTGGTIDGCHADVSGGGICAAYKVEMAGGEIKNCTTDGNGAGLEINYDPATIGGTAVIKDNYNTNGTPNDASDDTLDNLYISYSNNLVNIGTGTGVGGNDVPVPAEGMSIGVTLGEDMTEPTKDTPTPFSNTIGTDYSKYFSSDDADCCVKYVNSQLVVAVAENTVKYRYPVYKKTDGTFYENASSGIKVWREGSCKEYTEITSSNKPTTWKAGWYVVSGTVEYGQSAIRVSGDVHLILKDGSSLTVTGNDDAAITVSGDSNKLTIYTQSTGDDMGKLSATGDGLGAGIGGDKNGYNGNNITINGGNITATGGYSNAAGIGGADSGHGTNITINAGKVTATGGNNGAGIGGGFANAESGYGSNITIKGGTVTAIGGDNRTGGIGNGSGCKTTASGITVVTTLCVKADGNNPPTTEIEKDRTDSKDIASSLVGKRYVTIRQSEAMFTVDTTNYYSSVDLNADIVSGTVAEGSTITPTGVKPDGTVVINGKNMTIDGSELDAIVLPDNGVLVSATNKAKVNVLGTMPTTGKEDTKDAPIYSEGFIYLGADDSSKTLTTTGSVYQAKTVAEFMTAAATLTEVISLAVSAEVALKTGDIIAIGSKEGTAGETTYNQQTGLYEATISGIYLSHVGNDLGLSVKANDVAVETLEDYTTVNYLSDAATAEGTKDNMKTLIANLIIACKNINEVGEGNKGADIDLTDSELSWIESAKTTEAPATKSMTISGLKDSDKIRFAAAGIHVTEKLNVFVMIAPRKGATTVPKGTYIKAYINDGNGYEEIAVTDASVYQEDKTQWYAYVDKIAPTQYGSDLKFELYTDNDVLTQTLTYSVNTYCSQMSAQYADLCTAIYNYGTAAKAVVAPQ